jgi:hypothetical protein
MTVLMFVPEVGRGEGLTANYPEPRAYLNVATSINIRRSPLYQHGGDPALCRADCKMIYADFQLCYFHASVALADLYGLDAVAE